MSQPAVTVSATTAIEEAARLMVDKGLGGLLVVDPRGQLAGVLTQTDLLHRVAHPHIPPSVEILGSIIYLSTPGHMEELMGKIAGVVVGDAMSKEVVTAEPETPVADLADLMIEHKVGRVAIVSPDGHPVGVVTRSDLIRHVVAGMGRAPGQ